MAEIATSNSLGWQWQMMACMVCQSDRWSQALEEQLCDASVVWTLEWPAFFQSRVLLAIVKQYTQLYHMGMDQYLLIPFLGGWTSIYQLFWCSPGVQGFDTLPYYNISQYLAYMTLNIAPWRWWMWLVPVLVWTSSALEVVPGTGGWVAPRLAILGTVDGQLLSTWTPRLRQHRVFTSAVSLHVFASPWSLGGQSTIGNGQFSFPIVKSFMFWYVLIAFSRSSRDMQAN